MAESFCGKVRMRRSQNPRYWGSLESEDAESSAGGSKETVIKTASSAASQCRAGWVRPDAVMECRLITTILDIRDMPSLLGMVCINALIGSISVGCL